MAATTSATSQSSNYNPLHRAHAATLHVEPLLAGVNGTIQTLDAMARAVRGEISPDFSGYQDPHNAAAAGAIIRGSMSAPAALLRYVRDQISYVEHPWNMQVVQDCRRTLEIGSGDCVSKSVCLSTLLAACGIFSRFVAQATDGQNYDHVYVQARLNGQWVSLDPTADGINGRPLGDLGWSQQLPEGGIETPHDIFFSIWGKTL
jgi:hypothetical protein